MGKHNSRAAQADVQPHQLAAARPDWDQIFGDEEDFLFDGELSAKREILSQLQQSSTSEAETLSQLLRQYLQSSSRFELLILCTVSIAHSLGITDEVVAAQDEEQVYTCIQTVQGQKRRRLQQNAEQLILQEWGGWNICAIEQDCSKNLTEELARLCRTGIDKQAAKSKLLDEIRQRRAANRRGVSKAGRLMPADVKAVISRIKAAPLTENLQSKLPSLAKLTRKRTALPCADETACRGGGRKRRKNSPPRSSHDAPGPEGRSRSNSSSVAPNVDLGCQGDTRERHRPELVQSGAGQGFEGERSSLEPDDGVVSPEVEQGRSKKASLPDLSMVSYSPNLGSKSPATTPSNRGERSPTPGSRPSIGTPSPDRDFGLGPVDKEKSASAHSARIRALGKDVHVFHQIPEPERVRRCYDRESSHLQANTSHGSPSQEALNRKAPESGQDEIDFDSMRSGLERAYMKQPCNFEHCDEFNDGLADGWLSGGAALFEEDTEGFPGAESLTTKGQASHLAALDHLVTTQLPHHVYLETALGDAQKQLAEHQQRFRVELQFFRQQKLRLFDLNQTLSFILQHMKDHPRPPPSQQAGRDTLDTSLHSYSEMLVGAMGILVNGRLKNEKAILRHKEFRSSIIKQLFRLRLKCLWLRAKIKQLSRDKERYLKEVESKIKDREEAFAVYIKNYKAKFEQRVELTRRTLSR